ncbi:glucose-6-phosphate exchanger SLC37A4 isoform X2 [Ixodes scapularis]|uniref:glucose-6-phosphate exchanger SLC37A4 isoform X2 n=1 Tax=Ixodes scapularis TaxID=6945 RepID=UPI001A9DBE3D|nr:glucose-6-phosphate exchanger SLC37A4 isoform X2 [Ixodes scapularis]
MKLRDYQRMIFVALFLGYACYSYNRKSVSFALPALTAEGLSKEQAGTMMSAQNLAYAGSKFTCGVLADRLSTRLLFGVGLVLSGLVTLGFSATSVSSLAGYLVSILWCLNGIAQGCGWPALVKLLQQWFPPSSFGTSYGILAASSNISLSLAPMLASFLILNYDWRVSLLVAGALPIVAGLASRLALVDKPTDVGLQAVVEDARQAFGAKTGAVDWGQLYLIQDLGHSQFAASALMSCIEAGGLLGGILAGYLTDKKVRTSDSSRSSPRVPLAVLFTACSAVAFHLLGFNVGRESSEWWIGAIGLVLGVGTYGPMAIFGVVASESAPAHLASTSHAIVALAGGVGGVLAGLPFSIIAEYYQWRGVFLLLEVVSAVTAVLLFLGRNLNSRLGSRSENAEMLPGVAPPEAA